MLEIASTVAYAQPQEPFEAVDALDSSGGYDELFLAIYAGLAVMGYVGYRLAGRRWYGAVGGVVGLPAALYLYRRGRLGSGRLAPIPSYDRPPIQPKIQQRPVIQAVR
jgi:hypothetical protein